MTDLLRSLKTIPREERPQTGAAINSAKRAIEDALELKREELQREADSSAIKEGIDVTLPGRLRHKGSLHPVTQTLSAIEGNLRKGRIRSRVRTRNRRRLPQL